MTTKIDAPDEPHVSCRSAWSERRVLNPAAGLAGAVSSWPGVARGEVASGSSRWLTWRPRGRMDGADGRPEPGFGDSLVSRRRWRLAAAEAVSTHAFVEVRAGGRL